MLMYKEGGKRKKKIRIIDACRTTIQTPRGAARKPTRKPLLNAILMSAVASSRVAHTVVKDGKTGLSSFTHELLPLIKTPGFKSALEKSDDDDMDATFEFDEKQSNTPGTNDPRFLSSR